MNDALKYGLEQLEMLNVDYSTGLVQVHSAADVDASIYSIEEIIAIENALEYGAQYIYFRRFKDRPSIPQVYIYDYTSFEEIADENLINLHKRLYSSGHVPMFFVFTLKDIRIFNCFEKPAKNNKLVYKPLTTISLAAEISSMLNANTIDQQTKFKSFSGKSFDNGSFWEDSLFSKEFQFNKSAYEQLLTELKQALKDIIDQNILPANIARKIMVTSILIKYLEERKDDKNNSVFPDAGQDRISFSNGKRQRKKYDKNFFDQFSEGAKSFTDVLKEKGAGLKLFDYLASHFNGGVFELSNNERQALQECDLSRFGLFLEGKLNGVQFVFWRLYSFNDLPVELISNIYEEFLEKKAGVVYTPPYLVSFLLDEAMPLGNGEIDFKVIDPACGSGVFLVGAYRRLIYRWRKKNKWKKPSLTILKSLLKDNIFGSDKDKEAVNLTIFSLSLALCDELTPLQIWEDLEFDDLHEGNLFSEDFFTLLLNNKLTSSHFDLVIGNPPFEAVLTEDAKIVESNAFKSRHLIVKTNGIDKKQKISLPDNQIALLFLEQAIQLCKSGKLVCLIQPSGPLLYNNTSLQFRQVLLNNFNIPQIIDFTHISRVLFGKNGDVATAAIFIKKEEPTKNGLLHITVRRTKANKEKIYFELDTYDFHHVPRRLALFDPYIWKSNFLGGSRFHQLLLKFKSYDTLGKYLADKTNSNNWAYGEGYIIGNAKEILELKNLEDNVNILSELEMDRRALLKKKYKRASYITNQPTLPSSAFSGNGIVSDKIEVQKEEFFIAPRQGDIYKAPHILIKEIIEENNAIPIELYDKYLTFKHRIVGIHAPSEDIDDLQKVHKYLQNSFILFYLACTSPEYMVSRSSSILKKDIDNLPYTENIEELEFDEYDNLIIKDFWDYLLEFRRNGENSFIALNNATTDNLTNFGKIFCDVLASVYPSLKPSGPFITESYICYPFYFDEKPNIEFDTDAETEKNIEKLVQKVTGENLRLIRVVKIYEGNVIYLIKPKKLRYWLSSIALRDADETFVDLRKQGF